MCECGCADREFEEAFRVAGSKAVIAYQVFPGCGDCDYGPAVAISFFDSEKRWPVEGLKVQTVHPNEFGAGRADGPIKYRAGGFGFGLFDVEDLEAAAKELEGEDAGADCAPSEWLHDNGQRLISIAMKRFRERIEKERKRRSTAGKGKA